MIDVSVNNETLLIIFLLLMNGYMVSHMYDVAKRKRKKRKGDK